MFPVDAGEEGVLLDLLQAAVRADAAVGLAAESHYEIARLVRDGHLGWKDERVAPAHHLAVRVLRRVRAEGRIADEHLVHYHTERPPVGTGSIAKTY